LAGTMGVAGAITDVTGAADVTGGGAGVLQV
jgi:hypothetical protein